MTSEILEELQQLLNCSPEKDTPYLQPSEFIQRIVGLSLRELESQDVLWLLEEGMKNFEEKDFDKGLQCAQISLDFIWEKLNTGHWKDIDRRWREAYSVASLLKVFCSIGREYPIEEIFKSCDMGLLMGAPIFGNILSKVATILQRFHVEKNKSEFRSGNSFGNKNNAQENISQEKRRKVTDIESISSNMNVFENLAVSNNSTSCSESKRIKQINNCSSGNLTEIRQVRFPGSPKDQFLNKDCNDDKETFLPLKAKRYNPESSNNSISDRKYSSQSNGAPSFVCSSGASPEPSTNDISDQRHIIPIDNTPKVADDDVKQTFNLVLNQDKSIPKVPSLSLHTFQTTYMSVKRPVIIRNAISHWPAMADRRWNIEYIKSKAGCRTVPVEIGDRYTSSDWTQKLISVDEFIDKFILNQYSNEKGYLAQHQLFDQIPELKADISIPDYCCLGSDEGVDDDVIINAWFGPAGTVSPLHQDPYDNMFAQVVGKKYIRLYDEKHSSMVYPHDSHLLDNTSQVDVENADLERFPLFADAPYMECILEEGELLYIPKKCWHYVRSLSLSFSVSFWWS